MKNYLGVISAIILLNTSIIATGQTRYKFQKISIDKGLSQSVVNSIVQDHMGFMWFATQDGLSRFDGYKFTNYYNNPDDSFSLSNNFIQCVFRDNDNQIWVLTSDGLNLFDYEKERFIIFNNVPGNYSSISNNNLTSIAQCRDGNLWIGTYGGGFNYYNKKTKTFKRFQHSNKNSNSLSNDKVMAIYEDRNGFLWIGTQGGGLNYFNPQTGIFTVFKANIADPTALQSNYIRCIFEDRDKRLWIGTNKGLALFNKNENNFQSFTYDPQNSNSINGNTVLAVIGDHLGNLWVGTEENGLNKLVLSDFGKNASFEHFSMKESEYGLSIRTVQSIYEDRDNNIWIGTYSGGINFISCFPDKFEKYQHSTYDYNTINYPKVMGLCQGINDDLWIGTDGGGLDRLNMKTKTIKHYLHNKNNPNSISDNAILCGYKDHNNNLWFGTYSGGLNRYNPKSETFTRYKNVPSDSSSLGGNDVRVIYEDSKNNIWIGTNGGGLCRYNPKLNNFKVFNTSNSDISNNDVRCLKEDALGRLWIGHYGSGLDCYDPAKGTFVNYMYNKNNRSSIRSNYLYAILIDRKNRIWIGTGGGGLNLFVEKNKSFKAFTNKEGLSNNFIHAMLEDSQGNIWISTNKGISKFLVDEFKFENFDTYDGLQNGEFSDGCALTTKDGLMCFGGVQGLNTFYPDKVEKITFVPDVVLTDFQLFNTPIRPGTNEPDNPLKKSISVTKSITLNYKQSVFTIDYVALNYTSPEKSLYSYKMEGLDNEWNNVGTHRSATYRNLSPGQYTFQVKASNQDGIWSKKITSLKIIVLPPFWRAWWAYTIYILFIGLIGYIIIIYYKRENTLKNNLLLEQISRQKEHQLNQEKLRFFTNISHEFRTPLTLILGPLEDILEKETYLTQLGRKLLLIYKNANKLLDLINLLLDFRKIETGNMKLSVAKGNIVKFAKEICFVFREYGKQKKIQFNFISRSNEIELWFDREKLEIIFNNLLSNAFKYTSQEGLVTVEVSEGEGTLFEKNNEVVILKFVDTGIGINEKYLANVFESYYSLEHTKGYKGTGIGLALTKSLVELHKGKISVESTEGKGTCFTIEFLKGKEHFDPEIVTDSFKNSEDPEHYQSKRKVLADSDHDIVEVENKSIDEENLDLKLLLIVEDNTDVRAYIKDSFAGKFRILEASNGVEGIDLAVRNIPDIIISDVMMPEMDGIEFCSRIKSTVATCHIPLVLLTARSSLSHKREGYDIGADSYVTKPFSSELLISRVNNLLKSRLQLKEYYKRSLLLMPSEQLANTPDEKFLKRLAEIVEKLMSEPDFDVSRLAQEFNFSRPVLYRKVKALTNLSLIEFIRTIRLNRAAQMLKTGQYRVSEVAFEVGFNDLKHFRQCFKEQFNITPSELSKSDQP